MASENKKHEEIRVVVHYEAAGRPFEGEAYPASTPLTQVKQDALRAFGLTEGQPPAGTGFYVLFHDKTRLDNPNTTVGEVAGHHDVLELRLAQREEFRVVVHYVAAGHPFEGEEYLPTTTLAQVK